MKIFNIIINNLAKIIIFIKLKSLIATILLGMLAYFTIEPYEITRLLQEEKEITVQSNLTQNFSKTEIKLEYTVSNIGNQPVDFIIQTFHKDDKPKVSREKIFKVYSSRTHKHKVSIIKKYPFSNRLDIRIKNLKPGIGIKFEFFENLKIEDYWSKFQINIKDDNIVQHINRSPFGIWIKRFLKILILSLFPLSFLFHILDFIHIKE